MQTEDRIMERDIGNVNFSISPATEMQLMQIDEEKLLRQIELWQLELEKLEDSNTTL